MTHEFELHVDHGHLPAPVAHGDSTIVQGNRVFQVVVEDLKQRIRQGTWLPDERLPSIAQLAHMLDVSTGSVREALRSLQSIGLVTIKHGRGVFVTGARVPSELVELASYFPDVQIGVIAALAETRRLLEPELASLAAERGTENELAEIGVLAQQMESEAQQDISFVQSDMQFHRSIARAARNPILYRMVESIHDLMLESHKITSQEPGMTARAVRYHMLIAETLRDRNAPQARLLMLAHMNDTLNAVLAAESKAKQAEV